MTVEFSSPIPDRTAPKGREKNLPSDKYSRLTLVEEVAGQSCSQSNRRWLCQCDCGVERRVVLNELRRGNTMSCGCYSREVSAAARTTHGLEKHPLYATHHNMMSRCYNPENKQFADWGGRGIRVCERWHDIRNLISDMAPSHKPGLTLEREDNNLGYSPQNCVWATRIEQGRNKRNNRLVSYIGKNICLAEACEVAGLPYSRVHQRLNRYSWTIPRALESEDFQAPLLESAQTPEPLCLNQSSHFSKRLH